MTAFVFSRSRSSKLVELLSGACSQTPLPRPLHLHDVALTTGPLLLSLNQIEYAPRA